MAHKENIVFSEKRDSKRLPDWTSEGVVTLQWLKINDLWKILGEKIKVYREGGHAGIDVLLFLIFYFTSNTSGFKKFGKLAQGHKEQLGALGERKNLPSPSAVSRFLSAVTKENVNNIKQWLLMEILQLDALIKHPSTHARDGLGRTCHIFDWDSTVTVLRQRGLPKNRNLPTAKRRAKNIAKPGYPGRKRGDVQFSRSTLQHAGSGIWLTLNIGPGNGEGRSDFEEAVSSVVSMCKQFDIPLSEAIIRADGVAGNVPYISASEKAGIHYVTRSAHYKLLEQSNVIEWLNQQHWYTVPSSGSGPEREATELGIPFLFSNVKAGENNRNQYKPIEPRMVVSRFKSDKKHGAGIYINGWQYELFATNLSSEAWPTGELVQLYFGRCGMENRFGQEDSEFDLDHLFSYNSAGQEFVTLVGLFLWNFQIARGMELAQIPETMSEQEPTEPTPIETKTYLPIKKELPPSQQTEEQPSSANVELSKTDDSNKFYTPSEPEKALYKELDSCCDWSSWLENNPDWIWDPKSDGLVCPNGNVIPVLGLSRTRQGSRKIHFQSNKKMCQDCLYNPSCAPTRMTTPIIKKEVKLRIQKGAVESIDGLVKEIKKSLNNAKETRPSIIQN